MAKSRAFILNIYQWRVKKKPRLFLTCRVALQKVIMCGPYLHKLLLWSCISLTWLRIAYMSRYWFSAVAGLLFWIRKDCETLKLPSTKTATARSTLSDLHYTITVEAWHGVTSFSVWITTLKRFLKLPFKVNVLFLFTTEIYEYFLAFLYPFVQLKYFTMDILLTDCHVSAEICIESF